MARLLVDTLAGDYDPSEYEDDYRLAVEALVQAKLEGGEVKRAPEPKAEGGEVVDLLAALQRSVDAAKSSRGEAGAQDEEAAEASTEAPRTAKVAKKSNAKKTTKQPAKKAARKTAKKSASKRTRAKAS